MYIMYVRLTPLALITLLGKYDCDYHCSAEETETLRNMY